MGLFDRFGKKGRLEQARQLYLKGDDESFREADRIMDSLRLPEDAILRYYDEWGEEIRRGATGGAPPPKRGLFDFFGRKKPSDEAEAKRIINELETLKAMGTTGAKAVGKAVAVPFGIAESKTAGRVGIRTPFKYVEKPEAAKEIYNIAERVAADKIRKGETQNISSAINDEINKQFGKKRFNRGWFSDSEIASLANQGIASAADQVGYYEQQLGGRYAGQAVRKLEQVGAAASYAARKTPVVGGMLFGKVPTTPAERMKREDPEVRSAINKARIELQKRAQDIYEQKYKPRLQQFVKEATRIDMALAEKRRELEPITSRLKDIVDESKGPAAKTQNEEGDTAPF